MEIITSRKNQYVKHLRSLAADADYRVGCREYLAEGLKLLTDALAARADILSVFWKSGEEKINLPLYVQAQQFELPDYLYDYVSTLKNSGGPIFTVRLPDKEDISSISNAVILENVQDPGNVGTVLRTANALTVDTVILVGDCADIYNPKTVRASMGAVFRQKTVRMRIEDLKKLNLPIYGAVLSNQAKDVREVSLDKAAIAIGSEGHGLSDAFRKECSGEVIIPMNPDSESLNAAAAAAVLMWEMRRNFI